MAETAFVFHCWICGRAVDGDQEGLFYLRRGDLEEAETDDATWPPRPPEGSDDSEFVWVDSRAGWVSAHRACRSRDAYESHYEIPLAELRNEKDALVWTLRLMSEPWLDRTTWRRQIGEMVGEKEGPAPD